MRFLTCLSALVVCTNAIALDVTNAASIKSAASTIAARMWTYYYNNATQQILSGIPGELPRAPVLLYWWECGEMFMNLIDYWYYTGDTTYNDAVSTGMLFQTGPNADYMPPNQTKDLGNDDQVFWAFAAMAAAEAAFPNPPAGSPQWLALAQAVFNEQAGRWDTATCGGGLKWQIFSFNEGYNYKNSPSNLGLFNLAARLGAYTHNTTYLDWADKVWDWATTIGLVSHDLHVWDGTDDTKNCTDFDHIEWTYSSGMALHGAAVMYSARNNSDQWRGRINQLWNVSSSVFFSTSPPKVMYEVACEANANVNCNVDQLSFKSTYARFLAATTKYATWLSDDILSYLAASANAAAAQCIGQPGSDSCGTVWFKGPTWDGTTGVGQEMSALSVIQANLITSARMPVTNGTGGTSVGNPSAGVEDLNPQIQYAPITSGDRAGAGILTAVIIVLTLFTVYYGLSDEMSSKMPLLRK